MHKTIRSNVPLPTLQKEQDEKYEQYLFNQSKQNELALYHAKQATKQLEWKRETM